MRRLFLIPLLLSAALRTTAQQTEPRLDSIYQAIDEAIEHADEYLAHKQQNLQELHRQANNATTAMRRYEAEYKLYEAYNSYNNDSALSALNRCIVLADSMNRDDLKAHCHTRMGWQCSRSGFYMEALDYLQNIPVAEMKGQTLTDYYNGMNHLYGEMASYTKDEHMRPLYYARSARYRDSLLARVPEQSDIWLARREQQQYNDHHYAEAQQINDQRMRLVTPGSHEYAIVAFFRSMNYGGMGNSDMEKYWLAQSALADIKNAVMDQASLWSLADKLSREGDLERAHRYVEFSWHCTNRFSTHVRSWLVSPVLTMINDNYKQRLASANQRLTIGMVVVSLLTLLLLALYIYVHRKRQQLAMARNELKQSNDELSALNARLSALNTQLENRTLELADASRVKEEYIGKFLSLCSQYIDKLDLFRQKVNRKMKAKQLDELFRISQNEEMKTEELAELMQHFDATFLHLFPHFVEEFNELLQPEHRLTKPDNRTLPTDLRIFALIRLGIDDSSRIAEFLHYSPNTIYNYRARVKAKALQRDGFEEKVRQLCM